MRKRVLLSVGMVLWLSVPAQAKKSVYSPIVHEGEKEIEYYADWREKDDGTEVVSHELEFVYVYTNRDKLSLYGVWEDGPGAGNDVRFDKYKIEWIHQLFEQGERAWDAGIYVEYQINNDETKADKVEVKPLFERMFGKTKLTLNGVLEKEIGVNAGGGTELGWAAQARWQLTSRILPHIQWFGGLGEMRDLRYKDHSQLIGPGASIKLGKGVSWQWSALFGATDASEDLRVTSNLAYEWY